MNHPPGDLQEVARRLRAARRLVVLTGAGVSKESGIPTFRDALEGLWAKYDPTDLATPAAFQRNPKLVWDWYEQRRLMLADKQPNPGHLAIAELERLLSQVVVITQNVDGLHHAAGSTDVIELHGNLKRHKCFDNCKGDPTLVDIDSFEWARENGPPVCPFCRNGRVRPDIVWFTEALPSEAIDRAIALCVSADVMLVVGTSGAVQPAASLPMLAKREGRAFVIDVNPAIDEIAPVADVFLQGPSGVVLPLVIQAMRAL